MFQFALAADRVVAVLRAVAAAVICVLGSWLFLRAVGAKYAVDSWLVWQLLPIWGYALLFNAACVAGGAGVLGYLFPKRRLPALEWLVLSMAVGLTVFVLGMYVAGAFCRFGAPAAIALPTLMLVFGATGARRLLVQLSCGLRPPTTPVRRVAVFLALGFGATCLAFMYLEALDASSFNFDSRWYHYPIAQDYARTRCLVPFPGDTHRAYPHLTSIVHTWALLVPGLKYQPAHWMLSLHLEYSIVVWRIVAVAALIRWGLHGLRVPGVWVVFFLFPSIFIYDQNIGGSADHFLGFFAGPIALAAARTLRRFELRWAAVLGVVMAGHLLTKYQAIYLLVSVTGVFVLRWCYVLLLHTLRAKRATQVQQRRRTRRLLLAPLLAMTVAVAVSAPHFVKNAVFYNNPLYPYARGLFKASWPNVDAQAAVPSDAAQADDAGEEASEAAQAAPDEQASQGPKLRRGPFGPPHHGIDRQLWALGEIYRYSFTPRNRNYTKKRPYMGSLFSLLLPCLLLTPNRRRPGFLVLLGALAFLVWANTAVNDRYLLSFYDLFIGTAGILVVRVWQLGWVARAGLVPLVALQFAWGGDAMLFYGAQRLKDTMSMISAGYSGKPMATRLGAQPAQQKVTAATPRNAVILARNYKGLLGLDRNVLSDIRGGQFHVSYSGVRDSRELWQLLRDRGVTHLLYPEGQRPPVYLDNTLLFADLFHSATRDVAKFSALRLGTLQSAPPPPSAPFVVLLRKVSGYKDGVYHVEQLGAEAGKRPGIPAAIPLKRYSETDAIALVEDARAVVLGSGARLPADAQDELQGAFEQFERFDGFTVYLRRLH